jgi:hypothetical protein
MGVQGMAKKEEGTRASNPVDSPGDARDAGGGDRVAMPALSLESTRAAFRKAAAEESYWQKNHAALLAKYNDLFVAVDPETGAVVAAEPDLFELSFSLASKGYEMRSVWVHFVTKDPRRYCL